MTDSTPETTEIETKETSLTVKRTFDAPSERTRSCFDAGAVPITSTVAARARCEKRSNAARRTVDEDGLAHLGLGDAMEHLPRSHPIVTTATPPNNMASATSTTTAGTIVQERMELV